ncbi:17616_t:CDS:2 [Funneliformis caledonium]|uniref:17616_t:CDS:1 n=1 Tax=Funneliformis caledonium TaxID=1117310 RepID=A0A9N9C2K5_9GLOM|nr:17616_t:CDS:2 [Funneliformis caledonium]
MYGPVFGSSDLEMKEQFNKGINCWSQEYTYERKVSNDQNFCVDEYERQTASVSERISNDVFLGILAL